MPNIEMLPTQTPQGKKKPRTTDSHMPILRMTWLLWVVVLTMLLLLVCISIVAGHSFIKTGSNNSTYILIAIVMVVAIVLVPLFWSNKINVSFSLKGVHMEKQKENVP